MHVTACLAGQKVDVEVGEDCRTSQALKEAIVVALPQLCVEGFDVSVGGRPLDDEGVVSLQEDVCLDVSANSRVLSTLALREAGLEASEEGLLKAALEGDLALVTLFLDAGVPIDCIDDEGSTPLHLSCCRGHLSIVTLLLDRGSTAIDRKNWHGQTALKLSSYSGHLECTTLLLDRGSTAIDEKDGFATPLHSSCRNGHVAIATLLLDRGSTAIDEKCWLDHTPLHISCQNGHVEIARLLLDRGSTAIDEKDGFATPLHISCKNGHVAIATLLLDRGSTAIDEKCLERCIDHTPLYISCRNGHVEIARLLLDRGCFVAVEELRTGGPYSQEVLGLLSERGHDVFDDASSCEREATHETSP